METTFLASFREVVIAGVLDTGADVRVALIQYDPDSRDVMSELHGL